MKYPPTTDKIPIQYLIIRGFTFHHFTWEFQVASPDLFTLFNDDIMRIIPLTSPQTRSEIYWSVAHLSTTTCNSQSNSKLDLIIAHTNTGVVSAIWHTRFHFPPSQVVSILYLQAILLTQFKHMLLKRDGLGGLTFHRIDYPRPKKWELLQLSIGCVSASRR